MKSNTSPSTFAALLMLGSAGFIATDLYLPSLPAITHAFGSTPATAKLTLAAFSVSFCLAQLVYGPLSDRIGRRPVLLTGIPLYLVGSILCALAPSMGALLVGRFIQGAGVSAGVALCRVILRDLYTGLALARAIARFANTLTLAIALAPALGGFIQNSAGFRWNFLALLGFGITTLSLVFFALPESHPPASRTRLTFRQALAGYAALSWNRRFMASALSSGFALSVLIAYAAINPFLLQDTLGISAARYGVLTLCIASGLFIGASANNLLIAKAGGARLMTAGIALIVLSGVLMLAIAFGRLLTVPPLVALPMLATFGTAFVFPNSLVRAFDGLQNGFGIAGALFGFLQVACATLTSVVAAYVHTPAGLGVIFLALGLILWACDAVSRTPAHRAGKPRG